MAELFNKTNENRARIGKGSGLYTTHFQTDGLYALLAAFVKVPFIKKSVGEVEIKVACSDTITKIEGITTLEASETEIYLHRDSINLLENLDGKTIPLLSMIGDFAGYKYDGTISYTPTDVEMDAAWTGTVKITPVTAPEYIENCYPIVKPTALFKNAIPAVVSLEKTTDTNVLNIEMKYPDSTFTATSDTPAIATATQASGKLTIKGIKEGTTIIRLESSGAGCASWKTTILVIVPKAVSGT